MNYLGFDFGTKRIGVAVGQDTTNQAKPLCILKNNDQVFDEIKKLIDEWRPEALIMGLPQNPEYEDNTTEKLAKKFSNKLNKRFSLRIFSIDEHLSSFEAKQMAKELKIQGDRIDHLAAALILESWLRNK